MKKKNDEAPKPALIPLAKQGRTIVKGKCSACGATFSAREGMAGSAAEQFAKHLSERHAGETNGGLGSSGAAD